MTELIGSPRAPNETTRQERGLYDGGRSEPFDPGAPLVVDDVSGYPAPVVGGGGGGDDSDEDESVELETLGAPVGEDVVYEVAIAAASTGKGFDGPFFAELIVGAGPIDDVRLSMAVEVLRLGSKLTGDRMLGVLESLGFEGEVLAARITRDELGKVADVPVEAMTALPGPIESQGDAP